jgi:ethanolamine ammonia-lyase small subunit
VSGSRSVVANSWVGLRALTPARIALGRAGSSLPTPEVLGFGLAHARARDAVHLALDVRRLESELRQIGFETLHVRSAATDRFTYLCRPDLGRRLSPDSADALNRGETPPADLCVVVADGLSALAVQRHAVPVISAVCGIAPASWTWGPVVIAEQGRVALGDEIGEKLKARVAVMLIGERPGLSSPDSLGIYLTYEPRRERTDAERNCISNVRPGGLDYAGAARKLVWLTSEALRLRLTGVKLKDQSDLVRFDDPLKLPQGGFG